MNPKPLKVGRVFYKNTLPLFYFLPSEGLEVVEGSPRKLADLLALGLIDGGTISSLFYLRRKGQFVPLPGVSISSFGKSGSVILFSEKPLEEVKTVKPSPESLTSNFLLYAFFKKVLGKRLEFASRGADAELVIGDRALRLLKERRRPFAYDLGELWFQKTGLPAVFALFLVPARLAAQRPAEVSKLALALMEAKDRFFKELENLPLEEELKNYLKGLNYDFGREHLESLNLMEKLLEEA
ncbi:MAG: menaquinone biosynthesis protein [Aquificae bacterium]|nr:menaquinone biosynthesis protein [Aquificota bacterium]